MPSPRIAPARAPFEPSVEPLLASITPPGKTSLALFRTVANNPRVLQRMFAGSLLDRGSLSLREREIVILRTCARCDSEYEWGVHVALFAQSAGLTENDTQATLTGDGDWDQRERLLINLADQLHDTSRLSDALWESLVAVYRPEQIIELIALAGFYHTISFFTNGLNIECEPFAPRFPARDTDD